MTQPRNFSWFVEGKLAGMGYPMADSIPFLADRGIKTLVNITTTGAEQYYGEAAKSHGISVHCIDVPDFCPPNMEQIEEFLSVVDEAETAVGVHCAMGRGRTGTLLACYLVAKEGYSGDKAIEETRRRRRGSIETRRQEAAVREFEQYWKEKQ